MRAKLRITATVSSGVTGDEVSVGPADGLTLTFHSLTDLSLCVGAMTSHGLVVPAFKAFKEYADRARKDGYASEWVLRARERLARAGRGRAGEAAGEPPDPPTEPLPSFGENDI